MKILLLVCAIGIHFAVFSQATEDTLTDIIQATEFYIPTSGAFNLMGVNPTNVSRPGYAKDFRMDNFVKDGKLLDNIALDFQPFWLLLFKNKNYQDYLASDGFERFLGRMNWSAGTTLQNGVRQFAYSTKFTFQRIDPMMDTAYISSINSITEQFGENERNMELSTIAGSYDEKISDIEEVFDTTVNDSVKALLKIRLRELRDTLISKSEDLDEFQRSREERVNNELKRLAKNYIDAHWADPVIDIGIGQVFNYGSPNIDSISFSTQGFGVWVNPAIGISRRRDAIKFQITALGKWIQINKKDNIYAGVNLRGGSAKTNMFVEYLFEYNSTKRFHTFAFGLSYKVDNKKVIEIGLRRKLDQDFNLKSFYPTIIVNWALAKDILKN